MDLKKKHQRVKHRSGVALVISLCFLVLISVSVVAFLVKAQLQHKLTFSSVSQKKAEILAQSASNLIISELRGEMAYGSRVFQQDGAEVTDPAVGTAPFIFQPSARVNAVPEVRGGTDPGWVNLVKRSYPTVTDANTPLAFYTGGRPLVAGSASADTSVPSANGRFIDDLLWRTPELVDDGSPSIVPRWCIVTRQGTRSVTDRDLAILRDPRNPEYAIGRFAFTAYDVGGLLDINHTGNALPPAENANRAFLNQADLSQILAPVGTGESPVQQLLNWRSPLSQARSDLLLATINPVRAVRYGEQRFTGRQDLLHYAKTNPGIIVPDALRLLTVFSRELNAPSWFPSQNATDLGAAGNGANDQYAYKENQNSPMVATAANPNRFVPNVRLSDTSALLKGYHPDGRLYSYTVKPGEPLVQRRFPLGRLNWIGCNGPQNGGTNANIQACFGLLWNPVAKCWNYVGPTGNTPVEKLATLDMVASERREPNFFELLQTGILRGSLGLDSAKQVTAATHDKDFEAPEVQIMQIGANLIDQYDEDSYPTCLTLRVPATTSPPKASARYDRRIYGSENIPLIYKLVPGVYRPKEFNRTFARGWLEFEMWNPHQELANQPSSQPTSFRIRQTHGQFGMEIDHEYRATPTSPLLSSKSTPPAFPRIPTVPFATKDNSGVLTVTVHPPLDIGSIARDPKLLNTLRQQSGISVTSTVSENIFTDDGKDASYTGLYCGEVELPQAIPNTPPPASWVIRFTNCTFSPLAGFVLEYDYGDGDWRPVQELCSQKRDVGLVKEQDGFKLTSQVANISTEQLMYPGRRYGWIGPVDARTLRFGYCAMGGDNTGLNPAPLSYLDQFTEQTLCWSITDRKLQRLGWENPLSSCFLPLVGISGPNISANTPEFVYRHTDNRGNGKSGTVRPGGLAGAAQPMYTDLDGVQRFGDALWNKDPNSLEPDALNGVFPMLPYSERPQDRPVMLNRPFQNVGEMGFAFRDLPYKSLDFSTPRSADSALLDLFCIDEGDPVSGIVAGRVNLNTKIPQVLKAVLAGSTRTPHTPDLKQLNAIDAENLANAIVQLTSDTGPFLNPSELAQRLLDSPALQDSPAVPNQIKGQKEVAVRSLAALGQTRTWNLLIDVVAQVGRYSSRADNLAEFTVEGERRYWLHVAIDRYTGKVIDQILEPVVY